MNIIEKAYNWAYGLTPRKLTTHLIIHHAAASTASPDDIHRWHLGNGWAGIAYHYYVRKDGAIYRGRPEAMQGGHTTGWNYCSIGICFEGNFENEHMSDAQLEAGQALVADIMARYPTILIGQHRAFQSTACPGANFPFEFIVHPTDEGAADTTDDPSEWAKEAWDWAKGLGITDGTNPQGQCTREQLVTMLYRFSKGV